jgi:hypothetical protein
MASTVPRYWRPSTPNLLCDKAGVGSDSIGTSSHSFGAYDLVFVNGQQDDIPIVVLR